MSITNHERVGKAMELLKAGLAPFARSQGVEIPSRWRSMIRITATTRIARS